MAQTLLQPEIIESGVVDGRWMVVIFNNELTAYEDVVRMLLVATGCGTQEALTETWEAHHFGSAPVHFADRDECEVVATMIGTIGVRTVVRPEWNEA